MTISDPSEPITRSESPLVVEFPFADSVEGMTPNDRFFIRHHFEVPRVDPRSWSISIEGALDEPFTLSLEALRSMPAVTVPAVIECAGNGRAFMNGFPSSVQWELGGVGCDVDGVPLRDVLAASRLHANAVDVIFEGADHGPERKLPGAPDIHFARSVPLATAMRHDVILAYEMNGEPLEPNHGAPLASSCRDGTV
jgi:Sulfite oxidase and related enzymes